MYFMDEELTRWRGMARTMAQTPGQKVAMTDESGFHYDCRCDRLYARRWTTDYRVWAGRQNSRGIDTRRVGTTKQRSFHQMT